MNELNRVPTTYKSFGVLDCETYTFTIDDIVYVLERDVGCFEHYSLRKQHFCERINIDDEEVEKLFKMFSNSEITDEQIMLYIEVHLKELL